MFGVTRVAFHSHSDFLPTGFEAPITSGQSTLLSVTVVTHRKVSSWCSKGSQHPATIGSQDGSLDDSQQRPNSAGTQKCILNAASGVPGDVSGDRRPPAFLDVLLEDLAASKDGAADAAGVSPALLNAAISQIAADRPNESFVSSIFTKEAGGRRHTAATRNLSDVLHAPTSQAEFHAWPLCSGKSQELSQPAAASAGLSSQPRDADQPGHGLSQTQAFSLPSSSTSSPNSSYGREPKLLAEAICLPTRSGRSGAIQTEGQPDVGMSTGSTDADQSVAESTSGRTGHAGEVGRGEEVALQSSQPVRKWVQVKWRLELDREPAAKDEQQGKDNDGGGSGGGGGKLRVRNAVETKKVLRSLPASSSAIHRTGIHVAFRLPPVPPPGGPEPATIPTPTRAPSTGAPPSSATTHTPGTGKTRKNQDSKGSKAAAKVVVAQGSTPPLWATMPLCYHFAPIFKLCEANAALEEIQLPRRLVEIAQRMHSASQDTSSERTPPSSSSSCAGDEGQGESEVKDLDWEKWESGYLSDEDRKPDRSESRRGKASTKRTQAPRAKSVSSILPECTAYAMPGGYEVLLVQDARSIGAAIAWLRLSVLKDGVLGVDTEWPPQFASGVKDIELAMIQVASPSCVLLLHIAAMRQKDPSPTARDGPLYALLSDPSLTWVAAGWSNGDKVAMQGAFGGEVPPMRVVDVQDAGAAAGWPRLGLQTLARDLLGASEFSKPRHVTITNWAARYLAPRKLRYAALDALLPPLLLRQLRLFAGMPELRCSFCKQAFHAPAGVQQRPPQPGPAAPPGPPAATPSTSSAPAAAKPTDTAATCKAEQGKATRPHTSTDPASPSTDLAVTASLLCCNHCGRTFWAAQTR